MTFWSTVCKGVVTLGLTLTAASGCGSPSAETGPTEEPNIGPGGPAGGGLTKFSGSSEKGTEKPKSAMETKKATTK